MLKRLLPIVLLAGCAVSGQQGESELAPLPTTGKGTNYAIPPATKTDSTSVDVFLKNFYRNYTGFKSLTEDEIIQWGFFWCEAHRNGMSIEEITERLDDTATSENEVSMMQSIVVNAFLDLCPENG